MGKQCFGCSSRRPSWNARSRGCFWRQGSYLRHNTCCSSSSQESEQHGAKSTVSQTRRGRKRSKHGQRRAGMWVNLFLFLKKKKKYTAVYEKWRAASLHFQLFYALFCRFSIVSGIIWLSLGVKSQNGKKSTFNNRCVDLNLISSVSCLFFLARRSEVNLPELIAFTNSEPVVKKKAKMT